MVGKRQKKQRFAFGPREDKGQYFTPTSTWKLDFVLPSVELNHSEGPKGKTFTVCWPTRPNGHRWFITFGDGVLVYIRPSVRTSVRPMHTKQNNDQLCRRAWWVTLNSLDLLIYSAWLQFAFYLLYRAWGYA